MCNFIPSTDSKRDVLEKMRTGSTVYGTRLNFIATYKTFLYLIDFVNTAAHPIIANK